MTVDIVHIHILQVHVFLNCWSFQGEDTLFAYHKNPFMLVHLPVYTVHIHILQVHMHMLMYFSTPIVDHFKDKKFLFGVLTCLYSSYSGWCIFC